MVFEGDWPGVFIRGDNAAGYAMRLRQALARLGSARTFGESLEVSGLEDLASLLEGSRVDSADEKTDLRPFRECLPKDPDHA
jgi:hypothetical protein